MRIFTKLKTMKLKVLILAAIVFGVYMFISSVLLQVWFVGTEKEVLANPIVLPYVVVHLDLKGTPLKLSYLESLLPKMREFGANSLLMEYEDMFPYEGRLENLSAESCYTKNELIQFLNLAKSLGFEIIPLIQTFGHMEHVLKLDEFHDLREDHRHPDSICPSRQESNALVKEMLEQVIQLHAAVSPLKFIHIGCDEVYHLNKCQYCVQRNMSKLDIFVDHVQTVTGFVKSLNPYTTVLIWDDMLQDIKPHIWRKIGPLDVQPVYWEYAPKLRVTHVNLMQYHNKFRHIWIASAFKGADGRTSTFPILSNRFTNVFNWMNFIQDYRFGGESEVYSFKGMILTGWSRYTHMDPPCELLPVAYPSMIMTLLLIQKFKKGEISSSWTRKHPDPFQAFKEKYLRNLSMDCTTHSNVYNEIGCKFDGQVLYRSLIQHSELLKYYNVNPYKFDNFEYYSKVGLINTNQVLNNMASISLSLESLLKIEKLIIRQMNKYYKNDFIAEYVHFKTYHLKNKLQSALNALLSYSKKQSWSRRSKNISFYV